MTVEQLLEKIREQIKPLVQGYVFDDVFDDVDLTGRVVHTMKLESGLVINFVLRRDREMMLREVPKPDAAEHEFEIWEEGYARNGERGGARLLGKATGRTFREACLAAVERGSINKSLFNEDRLSVWGCRLFDNEAEARASFG